MNDEAGFHDLLQALLDRDNSAWGQFVREATGTIRAYIACQFPPHQRTAADPSALANSALRRAGVWLDRVENPPQSPAGLWAGLWAIVRRRCRERRAYLNALKRGAGWTAVPAIDVCATGTHLSADAEFEFDDLIRWVRGQLDPLGQRVLDCVLAGWEPHQVADELCVPPRLVKARLRIIQELLERAGLRRGCE